MKKLVVASLIAVSLLTSNAGADHVEAKALKVVKKETSAITLQMVTSRKDKVQLVEICKGVVTSQKRDGRILNTKSRYNYIGYRGVKGCHKGDHVKTYLYYDPHCNYSDCFYRRVDIVRCKHTGKTVRTDRLWLEDMCK